jgi:hypothetical protein
MRILTSAHIGTLMILTLFGTAQITLAEDPKSDGVHDDASRCKALKGDEKRACKKEMARATCDKLNGAARNRCLGVPSDNPDPVAPLGEAPRPPT